MTKFLFIFYRSVRKKSKMGFGSILYHTVAKRTSTFVLAIGISAFVFERGETAYLLIVGV